MINATIVVIEDEGYLVDAYKAKLGKLFTQVLVARDGVQALRLIHEVKPDLVLLDLNLPQKSGLDVLKDLKASNKTSNIPVLVASNNSDVSTIDTVKKLGAVDYYIKSNVSINELIEMCKKYLDS